jgi:nucleoside-diphosphate-sugar epimerase
VSSRGAGGGTVFLTGATGFIGGRLAAALHRRGYRLRCLVRNPARAVQLRELGADLLIGDVVDAATVLEGLDGADLAFHVAALYDIGRVDVAAMERTNIEGTATFLRAVREAGVPRAVHVSSTAALGPVAGSGDEPSRWDGPFPSHYHRTKNAAHHLALRAQQDGLPVVVACPSYVYGPGDEGPAGRFVEDILRHRLPGLPLRPTIFSYVYVDDVVEGLVAAGERGATVGSYVLGGEAASTNEFAGRVAREADSWLSPLRFPGPAVRLTGTLMDGVSRITGWRLPISREAAATAATGERWVHSYDRAVDELGYVARPLEAGIPPTVRDARARLKQQA